MSSQQLLAFVMARPFIPFSMSLADQRQISVHHSDHIVAGFAGLGLWVLHDDGRVEAIAGEAIVSMITRDAVDHDTLIG
jgi:hypothetical protein